MMYRVFLQCVSCNRRTPQHEESILESLWDTNNKEPDDRIFEWNEASWLIDTPERANHCTGWRDILTILLRKVAKRKRRYRLDLYGTKSRDMSWWSRYNLKNRRVVIIVRLRIHSNDALWNASLWPVIYSTFRPWVKRGDRQLRDWWDKRTWQMKLGP